MAKRTHQQKKFTTTPTTAATTKELKYKVIGASTHEYVADGMKNNNKERRFLSTILRTIMKN
ncbi:MAG: hypothetical protein LBJ12_02345 [Oscillospiraceae bacterium]|nr:hypothetical protein [Oscillospiraceae bacterium]